MKQEGDILNENNAKTSIGSDGVVSCCGDASRNSRNATGSAGRE